MKEEKIKSALEIAMEKVSDLPKLTQEEIEEQKEKEYGPVGEAIAKKYLSGTISDGELPLELAKNSGAQGTIIRRTLVAEICRELRLENDSEICERALNGLKILACDKSEAIENIGNEFWNMVDGFQKKKEKNSRQFELLAIERFRKCGIVGSAVRPNLNEDAYWKGKLLEIQNTYEPRLTDIRNRLLKEMQSGV